MVDESFYMTTKKQKEAKLRKLTALIAPKPHYAIAFLFKNNNERKTVYWSIRGKIVRFPTSDAAWLALDLLPWTRKARITGYSLVSATVAYLVINN